MARQKIGEYASRGAKRSKAKRRAHKTWAAIKCMTEGRWFMAGLLGAYDTAKGPNLAHMSDFTRKVFVD